MLIKLRIFTLLLPLFLFGCDGEWGSSVSEEEISTDYSGIYFGTFTTVLNSGNFSQNATILISENNQIAFQLFGNTGQISGNLTNSDGGLETSWSLFGNNIANVFHSKSEDIHVSLEETDTGFFGNWSGENTSGRVSFTRDEGQDQQIIPEQIAKNWELNIADSSGGSFTLSITLDTEGLITGSDTAGCVYMGNVDEATLTKRISSFNMSISSCGELDGSFQGLMAIALGASSQGDLLLMFASNDLQSFTAVLNQN